MKINQPSGGTVVGAIVGIVALIAIALCFGAWIGMLVFGALAAESEFVNYAPSFWETFFGLWSIGILGGAFNSTKLKVDTEK